VCPAAVFSISELERPYSARKGLIVCAAILPGALVWRGPRHEVQRLGFEQLFKISWPTCLTLTISDHDTPAFARKDPCLRGDYHTAFALGLDLFILALSDHTVGHITRPVRGCATVTVPGLPRFPTEYPSHAFDGMQVTPPTST
jgi:hypothetical protein